MQEFTSGDRVRIDIPDETNPDHEMYHGKRDEIVVVISDDAEGVTGDEQHSGLYCVEAG